MENNNIATVRKHLLDTLSDLRNAEKPMEVERAKAVADVARVLVDSAKVEVEFIRVTNQSGSGFMESQGMQVAGKQGEALPNGISSITRHTLQG